MLTLIIVGGACLVVGVIIGFLILYVGLNNISPFR